MPSVLGYWNIRGFGQPIRFMLAYVGEEYVEKDYGPIKKTGPHGDEWDYSEWYDNKFKLGLEFPNIPHYKDDIVEMTESVAILRYLADKYSLAPVTTEEKRRVYLLEGRLVDFRGLLPGACYCTDAEKREQLKEEHRKAVPATFKLYSDFLGRNKWVAGDMLTYVDFMFYEVIFHQTVFIPGCIDAFPNLKDYTLRFQALPRISKHMESEKFKGLSLFQPKANFESNFNFQKFIK